MANLDVKVVISAVDNASSTLRSVGQAASSIAGDFGDLVKASTTASFAFAGALTLAGKSIIDVASNMQQAQVAFTTMLGNTDLASKKLSELSDFAKATPFTFPQVVEGSKQLLAYGISADKLIPTMKTLGDIAAGVGMDKLPQLVLAFGQVQAKGHLAGQELLQFTNAGVGLSQQLQKDLGITRDQFEKLMAAGSISGEQVAKALTEMTSQGGLFFDLMNKQSKTVAGIFSNIVDQATRVALRIAGISTEVNTFGQVVQGGAFDLLSTALTNVLNILNQIEPQVTAFISSFLSNQAAVAAVIGALTFGLLGAAAAIAALLAPWLLLVAIGAAVGGMIGFVIQNLQTLMPWLVGIGAALATLATIILVNVIPAFVAWGVAAVAAAIPVLIALAPIIAICAAVGLAAAALYLAWNSNFLGIQQITQTVVSWFSTNILPLLKAGFDFIATLLKIQVGVWQMEWNAITAVVQGFVTFFGQVVDFIKAHSDQIISIIDVLSGGFISRFGQIKGAIEGVIGTLTNLLNKAREVANAVAGGLKIPGFATGGVVPGPIGQPMLAMVHGGEQITPFGGRTPDSGGGGSSLSLNVYVGMYAGSETEKRTIAENLYRALVDLAGSQNKSVAEFFGA